MKNKRVLGMIGALLAIIFTDGSGRYRHQCSEATCRSGAADGSKSTFLLVLSTSSNLRKAHLLIVNISRAQAFSATGI